MHKDLNYIFVITHNILKECYYGFQKGIAMISVRANYACNILKS